MLGQASKLSDFGWADECEILRVKEDDFPFSGQTPLSQRLEGALPVLLWQVKAGLHACDIERRQLTSNSRHIVLTTSRHTETAFRDWQSKRYATHLMASTHHAGRGTFGFGDGGVLEPYLHRVVS